MAAQQAAMQAQGGDLAGTSGALNEALQLKATAEEEVRALRGKAKGDAAVIKSLEQRIGEMQSSLARADQQVPSCPLFELGRGAAARAAPSYHTTLPCRLNLSVAPFCRRPALRSS